LGQYDEQAGGVGLEFLPSSISRGNLDELGQGALANILVNAAPLTNPHLIYLELINHGYGLLHLTPDSAVAEFWHVPILEKTEEETLAAGMVSRQDAIGWKRDLRTAPYEPGEPSSRLGVREVTPLPFRLQQHGDRLVVNLEEGINAPQVVEVVDIATGRILHRSAWNPNLRSLELAAPQVEGWYILRAQGKGWARSVRFAIPAMNR